MKLIENWKKSPGMFSVQAITLAIAIQGAWAALPSEMVASIPDGWVRVLTVALLVLGIIGRLIDQPKVKP